MIYMLVLQWTLGRLESVHSRRLLIKRDTRYVHKHDEDTLGKISNIHNET